MAGQLTSEERDIARRITGHWRNQLGSSLELVADSTGHLSGRYVSSVGHAPGAHPLTGYFDSSVEPGCGLLGFAVTWHPAKSVTVWAGRYESSSDVISATWVLAGTDPSHEGWEGMLLGHDSFRRSTAESAESGQRQPIESG